MMDPLELIRKLNEENPEIEQEIQAKKLRRSLRHKESKIDRLMRRDRERNKKIEEMNNEKTE